MIKGRFCSPRGRTAAPRAALGQRGLCPKSSLGSIWCWARFGVGLDSEDVGFGSEQQPPCSSLHQGGVPRGDGAALAWEPRGPNGSPLRGQAGSGVARYPVPRGEGRPRAPNPTAGGRCERPAASAEGLAGRSTVPGRMAWDPERHGAGRGWMRAPAPPSPPLGWWLCPGVPSCQLGSVPTAGCGGGWGSGGRPPWRLWGRTKPRVSGWVVPAGEAARGWGWAPLPPCSRSVLPECPRTAGRGLRPLSPIC